jgi:hypothetical protein
MLSVVIITTIIIIIRDLILGLCPMVKLSYDTTLSAPHFESLGASVFAPGSCTNTHNIHRNGTQI